MRADALVLMICVSARFGVRVDKSRLRRRYDDSDDDDVLLIKIEGQSEGLIAEAKKKTGEKKI